MYGAYARKEASLYFLSALLCLFLGATGGWAQAPPPAELPQPYIQFNFAPPGARSLGMGASFIGLADDATAAESNPAGLVTLLRPEISAHFRYSSFTNEFPNLTTGIGTGEFTSNVFSPSFFSIVFPIGAFRFSLYYQQAANFETEAQFRAMEIIENLPFEHTTGITFDYLLTQVGFATAVRLGNYLAIGGSIRLTRMDVVLRLYKSFVSVDFGQNLAVSGEITADDSKTQATFNAGVLINPGGTFSLGFIYKQGKIYTLDGFDLLRIQFFGDVEVDKKPVIVRQAVPDSYGGGIALRPLDTLVLVADVVRMEYSDLSLPEFPLSDATEFHGGIEYTLFIGDVPLALRAGVYTDPDHDIFDEIDTDQVHFTFGLGIVVGGNFQIDAAVNLAETVQEGMLSFVVRF